MSQHIVVTNYNPLWPKEFEKEARWIKDIIAGNDISIYHIGSTSVPGLAAKPIIDIMAVVRSLEKVEILRDYETKKAIRLQSLVPEWWSMHFYTKKTGCPE